jgi:nicotinamidase-related amidase
MRIFYSVETQIDFMNPGRSMYAPGVEIIKPNLNELKQYALRKGITQAGGLDVHFGTKEYAHREVELKVNGGPFPMHCENKTEGARQIPQTFIENAVVHPHYLDERVDRYLLREGLNRKGLLFEKQGYDIFTNPAIDVFMREFGVKEAVVSGVLTDWCVKDAVLGMQKRNVQVYLVQDAIYALNLQPDAGQKALNQMVAAGAKLVTTKQVLEGKIN